MAENTTEVVVGGVVLAAAIGFGIYAAQIAGISSGGDSYTLNASFRSLEGVSVGTDVRLAGVKIGTVTSVELNAADISGRYHRECCPRISKSLMIVRS